MRRPLLLGLTLLLAACSGSSSSGPSGAPVITNLEFRATGVTPQGTGTALMVGQPAVLAFVIGFTDGEGDVIGGPGCRVTTPRTGVSEDFPLISPAGADLNARSGQVACGGRVSSFQGSVPVIVQLRDRAGNISAPVPLTL